MRFWKGAAVGLTVALGLLSAVRAATHGAPYSAVGWQVTGYPSFTQTAMSTPTLSGLNVQNTGPGGFTGTFVDGPFGFASFWVRGYPNYAGIGGGLSSSGVMFTAQGGTSCIGEDPTGFSLPLDNSIVGTTALRAGFGNSACGLKVLNTPSNYGSGGTNGTYTNVPLTATSGSGSGATVNLTVSGGAVQAGSITIVSKGAGYQAGDGQTITSSAIPGLTGFAVTVNYASPTNWASAVSNTSSTFNLPFTSTTWNHILIAWNFQAGQSGSYITQYINGVQNTQFVFDNSANLTIPLNINYTNPSGWAFFGLPGPQNSLSLGSYADVFVDLTHNIMQSSGGLSCATIQTFINPSSGPCAVAGYGTTTPKRINLTGNCKDFFGWQPTFCFTNDNSQYIVNQGYGGAATLGGPWGYATATPVTDPVAVQSGILQPILPKNQMPFNAWVAGPGMYTGISSSLTIGVNDATAVLGSNHAQQCIVPGDLLVATIQLYSVSGGTTVTPPTGWTALTSASNTGSANNQANVFYRIATSADQSQWCGPVGPNGSYGSGSYTFTFPGPAPSSGYVSAALADYKNVNQANPIDQAGGSVNTTSSATVAFPTLTSAYPNELAVYAMMSYPGGTYPNSCMMYPNKFVAASSRQTHCPGGAAGAFSMNFADAPVPNSGTIVSGAGSPIVPSGAFYGTSGASVSTAFTIRGVNY